jgi:hypothetical protein
LPKRLFASRIARNQSDGVYCVATAELDLRFWVLRCSALPYKVPLYHLDERARSGMRGNPMRILTEMMAMIVRNWMTVFTVW